MFTRILLWFLLMVAVTVAGFVITTALTVSEPRNRQFPFGQLLRNQSREARLAYETGGREALTAVLNRFVEDSHLHGHLTDATGRDLASGDDRSAWVREAQEQPGRPISGGGRMILVRAYDDQKFWFFLVVPRRPFFLWFLHPHFLWILGVAVLLCYGLAKTLTSPLRKLQSAVDAFGQGDLSARVSLNRKDEFGQLSRNFDRMADRIETLMQAQRRLLLDISHELRSPLARLGVAVELARTGEDRDAALNRIQKEADRLNELVGELLQVTRAEVDPAVRKLLKFRLDQVIADTVEDCTIEAEKAGCRLRLENSPEVTMAGDPELLRRAIENIVRNAIRHAPAGTDVDVILDSNAARELISVRDRGPGVPEEALNRIFDAFYRVEADRNRSSGGVGLGLAIAQRAVELHNGTLRAKNMNPGLLVEIELLH